MQDRTPNRLTVEEAREALYTRQTTVIRGQQGLTAADLVPELQNTAPEYSPHNHSLANAFREIDAIAKQPTKIAETTPKAAIPVSGEAQKRSVYGFGSLFSWKPTAPKAKTDARPTEKHTFKKPGGRGSIGG